jgi:hypothetical protein
MLRDALGTGTEMRAMKNYEGRPRNRPPSGFVIRTDVADDKGWLSERGNGRASFIQTPPRHRTILRRRRCRTTAMVSFRCHTPSERVLQFRGEIPSDFQ